MIVFDTDILSTFAKINKLPLLFKLFPNTRLSYPTAVRNDLFKAEEEGYPFVNELSKEKFEIISLTKEENEYALRLRNKKRNLGLGEIEAITLCKSRNYILATNDSVAQSVAEKLEIEYISLRGILRTFIKEKILSREDVENLIKEIEEKDRVKITDKDKILGE